MGAYLHKAIENFADKRPDLLKNRKAVELYLKCVADKRAKKIGKNWTNYSKLINMLVNEFSV